MAGRRMDPYSTLGVPRDVDEKTLKSAYRKLAHQHHPDRNDDDPRAEERFKEISAAYALLSDPKRRSAYDEFGEIALDPNFDADRARQTRGPFGAGGAQGFDFGGDGAADLGSLFGEFFAGGGAPGRSTRRPRAGARGEDREITVSLDLEEAARGCERSISVQRHIATGAMQRESLRVQIPAGVKEGARIRLAGKGDAGRGGGR